MPNGALKILAEGICRAKMTGLEQVDGFISVTYKDLPTTSDRPSPWNLTLFGAN